MAPSQHIRVTDLPEEVRNGEAEKVHKIGEVSGSTPAGGSWEELLKGEVKEMLKKSVSRSYEAACRYLRKHCDRNRT